MFFDILTSQRLNLSFSPSKDIKVRIIECPGEWLPDNELKELANECKTIARECLKGVVLDYGIFSDDPENLKNTIITLIKNNKDEPIAFNAMPLIKVNIGGSQTELLHLGLVMVRPDVRSSGLSWILYGLTCILLFTRRQLRPLWVSSVTQVPAVVGMVAQTFDNVWPAQKGTEPSFAHQYIARQIMGSYRHIFGVGDDAGYDIDNSIITNAYTGGSDNLKKTFADAQKHRDAVYNEFCLERLNYERGDDVLQIGQLNIKSAGGFIRKSTPKNAIPQIMVQILLLSIQSIVAPIIQWICSDKQLGRLRPNK